MLFTFVIAHMKMDNVRLFGDVKVKVNSERLKGQPGGLICEN